MASDRDPSELEIPEWPERLQDDLEEVYEAYRHKSLKKQLDEIATEMEETLLQLAIARRLFDASLSVDEDVKERVEHARELLTTGDIESLDESIDNTAEAVSNEHTKIETEIHERRVQKHETTKAMRQLNEQLQVTDRDRLRGLEDLLDHWNWKKQVGYDETDRFEERHEAAKTIAEDMAVSFEEAKELIGQEFDDSTVRRLVDGLLNDKSIKLNELDSSEIEDLTESELGNYIELTLG